MEILTSCWNALAMMAPWLPAGFFLAGVASVLLPREWMTRAMGQAKGWRGVNALPPELLPDVAVATASEHIGWFEHASAALLVIGLVMRLSKR